MTDDKSRDIFPLEKNVGSLHVSVAKGAPPELSVKTGVFLATESGHEPKC